MANRTRRRIEAIRQVNPEDAAAAEQGRRIGALDPADRAVVLSEKGALPTDPQALRAVLQQTSDESAQRREASLAEAIPQATEPLEPSTVMALGNSVKKAAQALTGGQVDIPDFALPEAGPLPALPATLFKALSTLAAITEQLPQGADFRFDPTKLALDNRGIAEMMDIVEAMAVDRDLLAAKDEPLGQAPAPPRDLSRFVPQQQ
jgi:hypothetical protein